jgi:hypothetical protein
VSKKHFKAGRLMIICGFYVAAMCIHCGVFMGVLKNKRNINHIIIS